MGKSLCLLCCGMVLVAAVEGDASSRKATPKATARAPASASRSTSLTESTTALAPTARATPTVKFPTTSSRSSSSTSLPTQQQSTPSTRPTSRTTPSTSPSPGQTSFPTQQKSTPSTRPKSTTASSTSPSPGQTAVSTHKPCWWCWWCELASPTSRPSPCPSALPTSVQAATATSTLSPPTTRVSSTAPSASRTPSSTAPPPRPTLGVGTESPPPPTIMKRLHILLFLRDGSSARVSLDNHTLAALPGFDAAGRHTVLIVPGFTVAATSGKILRAVQAFLAHRLNVLVLDWTAFSGQPYFRAVYSLPVVSDAVAAWMNRQLEAGLRADALWLVGQSLGAHLIGRAAASMTHRPARITGLDPAGPLFWTAAPMTRLSRHQAAFVDVIHTDAGWHGLGLHVAVGHLDFWPNYGVGVQPGCNDLRCSHRRALELFVESVINPAAFPAVRCERDAFRQGSCLLTASSVAYMGFAASPAAAAGNYQLRTAAAWPYGLGHAGLEAKTPEKCSPGAPGCGEGEHHDEHHDEHPLALDPVWRWEDEYTED